MSAKTDPLWRRLAAMAYRCAVNAQTLGLDKAEAKAAPLLWYGGAKPGLAGGPALKLAKLQTVFPETARGFNLAYLQSAFPYLSEASFKRLRQASIPSVLNQNGVFYPAWFAGDYRARNRRMAIAHRLADHVFYQSDFCRRAALKFLGERAGPSEILFNAVDLDVFHPQDQQYESPFLFLVTGKIDAHQAYRVTQAIEGLVLARGLGLSAGMILAGVLEDAVKRSAYDLIARHGLEEFVLMPGPYTQAQAPTLYRSADAYLTLTHQDACPSGVIEALASGLPVIHPGSGGVTELVADAGICIETGEDWEQALIPSASAVAEAMLKAARDHDALSQKARARAVAHFDFDAWILRHRALFQKLLVQP